MVKGLTSAHRVASHLYRKDWIAAGVPPLAQFFDSLPFSKRHMCFHVAQDINKKVPHMYEVVGGIYTDTTFTEIVPGTEEHFGPFDDYCKAKTAWLTGMFNQKLDICTHRLFIREI